MKHHATASFWEAYDGLPEQIRKLADENFDLLKQDPRHPSLHFKRVGRLVGARWHVWKALAIRDGDDVIWFWIGSMRITTSC
ncbi:hypothetical protein AMC82_CH03140 [Rhizobium phaseoli]|uniref:hypothetical protein n=1 Tax=Rhizobium phaseoli TaxID=396 RepID=UPI0007F082ED|nr:hypothetical protein AMC84_CH03153 [Rhizobium phaseoli]ANL79573.1 hypothetical protein AMC82_CH03140 [Rhizobium phaseoli]